MAKIAVDFDGTIVEDRYPKIGPEVMFATDTLRMLIEAHHQLILWTVREGELLQEAVDWCHERGVDFWAVNNDYPEEKPSDRHFTRKIKADYFIDDRNIGGLPDWGTIYQMVRDRSTWEEVLEQRNSSFEKTEAPKRKKKWGIF